MRAEVVVPYLAGCPYRERAWEQVRARYGLPVTVGPGSTPWVKALAAMPAIERSTAAVVVVADADVWTDGLEEAIQAVEDGAPWAVPHFMVCRLTEDGDVEEIHEGLEGGGYVIARRETFLDVPLDPRFVGWGSEDRAWGTALRTLVGPPWRGTADLVHHWHPPQQRTTRTRGSRANWDLRKRYLKARAYPTEMRTLIDEAKEVLAGALSTSQP